MELETLNSVMLHPANRSIKIPGILSACLITGTDKIRSGFGNGDCLLIDLNRNIFAVADASERHPEASRLLLKRLIRAIAGTSLQTGVQKAYAGQKYVHKTTLSCVGIHHSDLNVSLRLANGGDSLMILYDTRDGSILYRTRADMNFAGRSRTGSPVAPLDVPTASCRLLLATDGFLDLIKTMGSGWPNRLPEQLIGVQVHEMAGFIRRRIDETVTGLEHDDTGVIALNPFAGRLPAAPCILMGGTRASEERAFTDYISSNGFHQWHSLENLAEKSDLLKTAGIRILTAGQ